ncbi:MAG: hypothetical protein ABW087_18590, partial [Candidatus Thiodiazotropha sp.]
FVFSMFYGETIVTKTIDYQASFLILNGTAVIYIKIRLIAGMWTGRSIGAIPVRGIMWGWVG